MIEMTKQAVTGVIPPQQGEALIREVWPSVSATPVATLGRVLTQAIITAPLAWGMMLPFYFGKILPFVAKRFTLTNRRLMIQRGLKPSSMGEVALKDIDEVRVVTDANSAFFRAANLDILSHGKVVLSLKGVPEPESFRHSILAAVAAWAPGKIHQPFVPASKTP